MPYGNPPDCRPKHRLSSVWLKFSPAFFKRRRGRGRGALSRKAPKVPEILLRKSFRPQTAKYPFRRRTRAAIRGFGTNPILLGQILQSRFAAEQREASSSFSAPSSCREKVAMAFVYFLFQLPFVYSRNVGAVPDAPPCQKPASRRQRLGGTAAACRLRGLRHRIKLG